MQEMSLKTHLSKFKCTAIRQNCRMSSEADFSKVNCITATRDFNTIPFLDFQDNIGPKGVTEKMSEGTYTHRNDFSCPGIDHSDDLIFTGCNEPAPIVVESNIVYQIWMTVNLDQRFPGSHIPDVYLTVSACQHRKYTTFIKMCSHVLQVASSSSTIRVK